jgi:hypothetical protein
VTIDEFVALACTTQRQRCGGVAGIANGSPTSAFHRSSFRRTGHGYGSSFGLTTFYVGDQPLGANCPKLTPGYWYIPDRGRTNGQRRIEVNGPFATRKEAVGRAKEREKRPC